MFLTYSDRTVFKYWMIKCSIPGKTASLTLIPLTKNLSFKTVLYSCEEAAFLQKLLFFSKHVYKPFFLDDFSHLSRTHTHRYRLFWTFFSSPGRLAGFVFLHLFQGRGFRVAPFGNGWVSFWHVRCFDGCYMLLLVSCSWTVWVVAWRGGALAHSLLDTPGFLGGYGIVFSVPL